MNLSEQELIGLYEHAPCGFHSLDSRGVFLHVNQTELQWLGYRYEEMVGRMRLADVLTFESQQAFERNFQRFKTVGLARDLEFDMVRKNGSILPVLVSASALRDPEGNFLMSRSVVYNLTDRLWAHVWFRAILNAAPDAMIVSNRSGDILLANSQAEKLFGYRSHELRGQPVEMLVPEKLRAHHVTLRAGFFASPHVRSMDSGFEMQARRKDGKLIPVEISLSPLEFDQMLVGVAAIRDLTERRKTEENARRSQAQYKLLFENSMDGILLTSPDGAILEANPSACRILGRSHEAVLKAGREGLLDTADPAYAHFLEERRATGKATAELRGKRPDGTIFPQEVSSVVFEGTGGKQCSCVIFRDISTRKPSNFKSA